MANRALWSDHSASEILKSPILPAAGLPDSSAATASVRAETQHGTTGDGAFQEQATTHSGCTHRTGVLSLLEITRSENNGVARILSGRCYRFKDWDRANLAIDCKRRGEKGSGTNGDFAYGELRDKVSEFRGEV